MRREQHFTSWQRRRKRYGGAYSSFPLWGGSFWFLHFQAPKTPSPSKQKALPIKYFVVFTRKRPRLNRALGNKFIGDTFTAGLDMLGLQTKIHGDGDPCCQAGDLSLRVCGDGWFNLCTLIAQCATGVQLHPTPISLPRARWGCFNQPSSTHTHTHTHSTMMPCLWSIRVITIITNLRNKIIKRTRHDLKSLPFPPQNKGWAWN